MYWIVQNHLRAQGRHSQQADLQLGINWSYNYLAIVYAGGRERLQHVWKYLMLRLTKKADYGLIALKHLAELPEGNAQSAKDIAQAYHIPTPLLAKILQTLTRSGLVVSHAGIHGGYSLARPANKITAFEVIRAIEGPLFIAPCTTSHGDCDLLGSCTVKEPLRKLNDTIQGLLHDIRISDLCEESREAMSTRKNQSSHLVTLSY